MEFEKTFNYYNDYKTKDFIYESIEDEIREDEKLLCDGHLQYLYELPFVEDYCKDLDLDSNTCNDIQRFSKLKELQIVFNKEYEEYINEGKYFFGCSFKIYENTYEERLNSFLSEFEDASEKDFIQREYLVGDDEYFQGFNNYERLPISLPLNYYQNKRFSITKRNTFLENKLNELGYEIILFEEEHYNYIDSTTSTTSSFYIKEKENRSEIEPVNWEGSPTELVELIKALYVTKSIDNSITEKEVVKRFEKFFNFKINNYDQAKSKVRNREKDLAIFINKLGENLEYWIKKKY